MGNILKCPQWEAKKLGKEAHAAVKARLTQERATALEAKKIEWLRISAEQKAEKARLAAESKGKRIDTKVRNLSLNYIFYLTSIFLREPSVKWSHKLLKGSPKVNSMSSLLQHHPLPRSQTKKILLTPASLKTSFCFILTIRATS